jgi:hypothetical protein
MENTKDNGERTNPLSSLSENLQEYVHVQSEILKLEVTDKLAASTSYLALAAGLGLLAFLTILFIGLSAGYYLSELLGSTAKGFSIVAGVLLLKLIIVIIFRKKLITDPIRNKIIQQSFQRNKKQDGN